MEDDRKEQMLQKLKIKNQKIIRIKILLIKKQ